MPRKTGLAQQRMLGIINVPPNSNKGINFLHFDIQFVGVCVDFGMAK